MILFAILDQIDICEKKAVCGPEKINIIEGSTGEGVTLLDDENINMALSKMTFAISLCTSTIESAVYRTVRAVL